jgi:hypothetical protein
MPKYAPSDGGIPLLSTHLGGTAVSPNGTATALTPAAGATSALIAPAGAACYYNVNGGTVTWAGYVPADNAGFVLPIDNFGTLTVQQASGTVHVQWYQD